MAIRAAAERNGRERVKRERETADTSSATQVTDVNINTPRKTDTDRETVTIQSQEVCS